MIPQDFTLKLLITFVYVFQKVPLDELRNRELGIKKLAELRDFLPIFKPKSCLKKDDAIVYNSRTLRRD